MLVARPSTLVEELHMSENVSPAILLYTSLFLNHEAFFVAFRTLSLVKAVRQHAVQLMEEADWGFCVDGMGGSSGPQTASRG